MKSAIGISILFLALVGCNGQNPANRESNPIKKYNGLNFDTPSEKVLKTENDGPQTVCGVPFLMTVTDSKGKDTGGSLHFLVNQNSTYQIHIVADASFNVSLAGQPSGVKLSKVDDSNYDLSWSPTARQGNLSQDVQVVLSLPKDDCVAGDVYQTISMSANVSSLQPIISVKGIDSDKMYQSSDKIAFQVTVVDPTLTAGQTPQPIQLISYDKNPTGETALLNSEAVAKCGSPQSTAQAQTFNYSCSLDIGQLITANPTRPTGLTALEIYVQSAAGESSVHVEKQILVNLPTSQIGANL